MSDKLVAGGEKLPPVKKLKKAENVKPIDEELSVDFAFSVKENPEVKTEQEDLIDNKDAPAKKVSSKNLKPEEEGLATKNINYSSSKNKTSKGLKTEDLAEDILTPAKTSTTSRKSKNKATIDSGRVTKSRLDELSNKDLKSSKDNLGLVAPNPDYIDPEYNAYYGDVWENANFDDEENEALDGVLNTQEGFEADTDYSSDFSKEEPITLGQNLKPDGEDTDFDFSKKHGQNLGQGLDDEIRQGGKNNADYNLGGGQTSEALGYSDGVNPSQDFEENAGYNFQANQNYNYSATNNGGYPPENYPEYYPEGAEYSWQNSDPPLINENTIFYGEPKTKNTNWWLVFTIILGIYFILSTFTFNCVLMPVRVEGASMEPTINNNTETYNDVVYLQKTTSVSRGDIVVVDAKNYGEPNKSYIKRVVAVAGDTVQFVRCSTTEYWVPLDSGAKAGFENGILYGEFMLKINGEVQYEDYITNNVDSLINEASKSYNGKIYQRDKQSGESLHAHEVDLQALEVQSGVMILYSQASESFYNTYVAGGKEFTVPEGSVFVLGDNRTISNDSKFFGAVNTEDIIGKVRIHKSYDSGLIQAIIYSIQKGYLF